MTTPLTTTYNGWANFETWQFMMWYGDTLQGMVQEIMDEMDDFEYGNAYVIVEGFVDMLMEENNFEGYFFRCCESHNSNDRFT